MGTSTSKTEEEKHTLITHHEIPEVMDNCLFHTDRLKFDQLEKELRRSKWIPKSFCHRLASAICSCRKNIEWKPDWEQLSKCSSYFRARLETDGQNMSPYLAAFIKNILDSVTATDCSRCRFLNILFLAQKGDFSLLTRQAICKNSVEIVDIKKPKRKPNKLTQKQYDIIMRKKRKRMESEVVELPMFPGNIKRLEANLGSNLADYSKERRFIYELKYRLNNRCFDSNVNKTYIQIWYKTPDVLRSIKACLIQKARTAQLQAQRDKELRKERKAQLQAYYIHQSSLDALEDILCFGPKLSLDKNFKWDNRQDKHTGRRHVGRKQVKMRLSAIRHCFNCHMRFSRQSETDNCKHHPGFVLSNKWSCCDAAICNPYDLENEHLNSGCVEGEHNWRTHKKANRKPNRNFLCSSECDDDETLRCY